MLPYVLRVAQSSWSDVRSLSSETFSPVSTRLLQVWLRGRADLVVRGGSKSSIAAHLQAQKANVALRREF